jgi:hypothetical protein
VWGRPLWTVPADEAVAPPPGGAGGGDGAPGEGAAGLQFVPIGAERG